MHSILHFYALLFSKLLLFLAFSFFVSGCHTGSEPVPVPEITAKREKAGGNFEDQPHNITKIRQIAIAQAEAETKYKRPGTSDKKDASGFSLPENQKSKSGKNPTYGSSQKSKNNTGINRRDPFALPEVLRKQQSVTSVQQNYSNQIQQNQMQRASVRQQTPLDSQEPCVAGIFNNGTEYYALIRWQQVQGIFRCGENLGNGYYLKEITTTSVLLSPEQSHSSINSIMLTLY